MSNPSKNKTLVFIIFVLLFANVAMLVYFLWLKQPDKSTVRNDRNTDRFADALKRDVGFSDSQVAQYKEMKEAKWDKIKLRFDELRKAKDNLFGLISLENISDSLLNDAGDSIAQRQKLLDLQAFVHLKELRKVCTPEQQPKYDSLVQRIFHRITGSFMRGETRNPDSTRKN